MNFTRKSLRWIVRQLVKWLFRVRVFGLENFPIEKTGTLIVANYVSRLDGIFLHLFLPRAPVFAIQAETYQLRWYKLLLGLVESFELDPNNPNDLKTVVTHLKQGDDVVIFPEGRATATGSLMKIYEGPALAADLAKAELLPVGIEGLQYSRFSSLEKLIKRRLFPRVEITILAPRRVVIPDTLKGSARRAKAASLLLAIMREIAYENAYRPISLYEAVVAAMRRHGSRRLIIEDSTGAKLTYRQLLLRANVLGQFIAQGSKHGESIGVMLPSTAAAIVTLVATQSRGRAAAMLNFTAGVRGLVIACETAQVKVIYTSRAFVEQAELEAEVSALSERCKLVYLEDLRAALTLWHKLRAAYAAFAPTLSYRMRQRQSDPHDVAIVLFTSGSEGIPKGVVLTHSNMLANRAQVQTLLDLTHQDLMLNVLPTFHAFGLLGGVLLPLLDGAKIYCYPSPLHYRVVPELSYQLGATCLFGTNTFLAGYAKHAHPYDFHKIRYIVAGAEKVTPETREVWAEKFGIRVFEGYGATEASPVIAVNTPMGNKPNSVGQLLAKMEHYLEPVDGIAEGGRLAVRGPNIMRGYLFHGGENEVFKPSTDRGQGWYDTGDIVTVDDDLFITIVGRQKRFAKIAGEMVSLSQTEELAQRAWPDRTHAAVAIPDPRKGEQIILLSEHEGGERADLVGVARQHGIAELAIPKQVVFYESIPLLGSGKINYPAVLETAKELTESA